jgi:hypothetical protein
LDCKLHGVKCLVADSATSLAAAIGTIGAAPVAADTADSHDEATAPSPEVVVRGWDRARGPDYSVEIVYVRGEDNRWGVLDVRHGPSSPAFGTAWPTSNTGTVINEPQKKEKTTQTTPRTRE